MARSLDPARVRAEKRVQRFIEAALDLMSDSAPGMDFTVQDVVEKSGQSLRSFYQYFGGKQELLLALFEESVRSTAEDLQDRIGHEADPVERLHRLLPCQRVAQDQQVAAVGTGQECRLIHQARLGV